MIHLLSIQNFAIVDKIEIEFGNGLNVLTGETGAGKSLIIGALNLLVGARPNSELIRTGSQKATIQAVIEDTSGTEIIVRREISVNGRNRIYIDQNLATVAQLRLLGERLIDLHGQHQHQALLNPRNHIDLLDNYARLSGQAAELSDRYKCWQSSKAKLERDKETTKERGERGDYLRYQLNEIETVSPTIGEDIDLNEELRRLTNSERLVSVSTSAYNTLYEKEQSIIGTLGELWKDLREIHKLDSRFDPHEELSESISATLDDLSLELRSYASAIEVAPERLVAVQERLVKLESLNRKYGGSVAEVLTRKAVIEQELEELSGQTQSHDALGEEVREKEQRFIQIATALSEQRKEQATSLTKALLDELSDLSITDGKFKIHFREKVSAEEWNTSGIDDVQFFFSANPGEELRPLSRVASGGELSRLALGLKTITTVDGQHKTLVFDEIDTGISGSTAEHVGERLAKLGQRFQVLCVTHSPQIASHAQSHYHVSKNMVGERVRTEVTQLRTDEQRAEELAQLMTGTKGQKARASALELLDRRR